MPTGTIDTEIAFGALLTHPTSPNSAVFRVGVVTPVACRSQKPDRRLNVAIKRLSTSSDGHWIKGKLKRWSFSYLPRLIAFALVTFLLTLSVAPTRSSEAVTADDTARFLAGLPVSSNSPLAAFTSDPVWLSHARNLNSIFAREESAQLSKVRDFSEKYLTEKHDTVFYMFSGPDFLYATSFFPKASTYILAGLEPVGPVPDLMSLSPLVIDGELRSLEASMSSLFSFSFFITHKMKTQLREGQFYGALPILYVFLRGPAKQFTKSILCVWMNKETSRSRTSWTR